MKFNEHIASIRDIELELESKYDLFANDLLSEITNETIYEFTKDLFDHRQYIPNFRELIDEYISYGFHKLDVNTWLDYNDGIITDYVVDLDNRVEFVAYFLNNSNAWSLYLCIEFNENNEVSDISTAMRIQY